MLGSIDWTPVVQSLAATNWTAILIAVVAAATALIGPVRLWKKQMERESESVKASLFAEVSAIVEIVERRLILEGLRANEKLLRLHLSCLTELSEREKGSKSFEVHIDNQYNRVYQGNVSKLGVLTAEDAKEIVRFYQLVDSARLDVVPGGFLAKGTKNPDNFKQTADLLEMALGIGRTLTAPVPKPSRKWWSF
ncbi:hypothetical protein [Pseudomonas sp. QD4]|uniref:hypothetical protein n=1 Tax=Pseudomonas sp. QD4 TaxID=3368618 RepID=UPI003B9FBF48